MHAGRRKEGKGTLQCSGAGALETRATTGRRSAGRQPAGRRKTARDRNGLRSPYGVGLCTEYVRSNNTEYISCAHSVLGTLLPPLERALQQQAQNQRSVPTLRARHGAWSACISHSVAVLVLVGPRKRDGRARRPGVNSPVLQALRTPYSYPASQLQSIRITYNTSCSSQLSKLNKADRLQQILAL